MNIKNKGNWNLLILKLEINKGTNNKIEINGRKINLFPGNIWEDIKIKIIITFSEIVSILHFTNK